MTRLCFVDTETISLERNNPDVIWEVALIVQDLREDGTWIERYSNTWQLPVDLGQADPIALKIGQFYERRVPKGDLAFKVDFAEDFAKWTGEGAHLVGAIVSFDEERLTDLLRANGACPGWHYHIVDVEALCIGYLTGRNILEGGKTFPDPNPPWKSDDIWQLLGIDHNLPEFEKHTAMGDTRLVQAVYNKIMGIQLT